MLKSMILAALVLFMSAASVHAQDSYPTAEIFGGYSYLNIEGDLLAVDRQGLHGAGFSFAGNLSKKIGIVGDFSYHRKEIVDVGSFEADVNAFYFLVGPRFSWRSDQVTAFGHALVGGVRSEIQVTGFGDDAQTDLALGFGGGLDVNVTKNIAIRVFQGDYLPTRVDNFNGDKRWANHFRAQAGIVIRLGGD